MAVTHHKSSTTIRGITYNYGDSFKCYASYGGTGNSEGGGGSASDLTVGTTYYYLGYAIDDDTGNLPSYPYAVGTTSSGIRGWYKENVFPYATYTIKYNANGGTGAPSSQTKTHNTNLTLSSTKPTRTGYTFKGWALSQSDANNGTWYYQAGSTCGKNENLTLYAVWEANSYTYNIVYKSSSGGQLGTGTITYDYGTTNTINPKSFTGYANPSSQSIKWDSTSAKTITFTYTPYKLTVNYYSNYADYGTYKGEALNVSANTNVKVHSQEFLYDVSYSSALSDVQNSDYLYLSRTGYVPLGNWGTETDGGTLISENADYSTGQALAEALGKNLSGGNASINMYPQWHIRMYDISYNPNGGYGSIDEYRVAWNDTFTISDNTFTREGYKFVGWNLYRNNDNKWYVVGQGWLTEDEILANGYSKKVYSSQDELTLDISWIRGLEEQSDEFTFYAIWEISGVVYIDNGNMFEPYLAYIDNGISWDLYLVYVDDGIEWKIIS